MKKNNLKKMISVMLSVLMLAACFAFAMPVSAAEDHECEWVMVDLVRPATKADGTWGNGLATYECTVAGKHIKTKTVYRADYSAFDAIIAELAALLDEPTLSAASREEIETVLATKGVSQTLIEAEQAQVDAAVAAITEALGKYVEKFTVTFVDADGAVLSEQQVTFGFDAVAPAVAFKEGYVFLGWDKDFTNVSADLTVTAQYFTGRGYIESDTAKLGMKPGAVKKINASLVTDEDIDKTITWTVADTSIASVDADGNVTALKIGYTTLTLSAMDGAVTKAVDLYVYDGNEDYTITLMGNGMGNFVINGSSTSIGFAKVKSGNRFRFQFALNSKYDPADVIITANGKEVVLGADNYFEIPYVCEDLTVSAALRSTTDSAPTPEQPEGGNDKPVDSTGCNCMCHSDGIFGFLWDLFAFFGKLLGLADMRMCECGAAHW